MKKIVLSLLSALAIGSASSASFANQMTIESSIGISAVHVNGVDVRYSGIGTDVSGTYDKKFAYDVSLATGEINGQNVDQVDMDVAYHFGGYVGPAAGYTYVAVNGVSTDRVLVGASAAYQVNPALGITAKLLSDIDHFGDEYDFAFGGTYKINGTPTLLTAEFEQNNFGGIQMKGGTIGVKHDLSDKVYLSGKAGYTGQPDAYSKSASIGVGFNF